MMGKKRILRMGHFVGCGGGVRRGAVVCIGRGKERQEGLQKGRKSILETGQFVGEKGRLRGLQDGRKRGAAVLLKN